MDVVELVTEIETVGDYGMQVEEVQNTFHVQVRCVGCEHSKDSWCAKHHQWAYVINNCDKPVKVAIVELKYPVLAPYVPREPRQKPVRIVCLDDGTEYESAKVLAELLDVSDSAVCNCCCGRMVTLKGKQYSYIGEKARGLLEVQCKTRIPVKKRRPSIPVKDRLTNTTYDSCRLAAESIGCGMTTMYRQLTMEYDNPRKRFEYVEGDK